MRPSNNISENELAVLRALSESGGIQDWLTAPTIAQHSAKHGAGLSAPNIRNVLSRMHKYVEYRTSEGVRRFHLKKTGLPLLVSRSPNAPAFISPGTPWSTQRTLRSFLKEHVTGILLVIDPYVSEDTLDVLADVTVPIQVLASNLGRRGKEENFARAYKSFRREKKGQVDLRQIGREELHGRYILTDNRGWVVDHSLQDLGSKPALILPLHLENVFAQVHSHFSKLFQKASRFEPS